MTRTLRIVGAATSILAAIFLLFPLSPVSAKTFISYNGQFHLSYPESWEQIDFRSVDFYLTQNNPNPSLLDYEAVFAPISTKPFYEEPYLLLTVDKIGESIGPVRDSVLASIAAGFSGHLDSVGSEQLLGRLVADQPLYVPDRQMIAVQTDIHEGRTVTKRNLLVVRFCQRGLVNFYFYAPDSLWTASLPTFFQIAQSFTPGTQPTDMPKETLKVADLSKEDSTSPGIGRYWPVPPGIIVILIAILAARRRRRRREENAASKS
jgi:hypothetical protein